MQLTKIVRQSAKGPVACKAFDILSRELSERFSIYVTTSDRDDFDIELAVEPGIGSEGFTICNGANGSIRIIGNDERGMLYGVGKFLRSLHLDANGSVYCRWNGTSIPQMPVRGMYFATHFHNFYHDAPINAVQRYIEELALWGMNNLCVWFDMHHFNGLCDPEAQVMLSRLQTLLKTARSVGIDCGLTVIANEGYANTPEEMRAKGPGKGGFYGVEICPNAPGGQELILTQFRELFGKFQDIGLDNVWIWPYDQGSCSCEKCRPWGANGFVKIAQPLSELIRECFPGCKVVVSTWYFDQDEWEGLAKTLCQKSDWLDYVIAEPKTCVFSHRLPGDLPMLGFPEISMHNMWPWGGFGANPQPKLFQEYWNGFKTRIKGGFPYSEGIFEDINKVIFSGLYWDADRTVDDILREYISYEYSPDALDEISEVVTILEQNHHMRWWPGLLEGYAGWFPSKGASSQLDPRAEDAYEIVKLVDKKLPEHARKSWRWRVLYLRALLDAELKKNNSKPNELCEQAFEELIDIYYVQNGTTDVKPPQSGLYSL